MLQNLCNQKETTLFFEKSTRLATMLNLVRAGPAKSDIFASQPDPSWTRGDGLAQLVATLVRSTKLLYAGPD